MAKVALNVVGWLTLLFLYSTLLVGVVMAYGDLNTEIHVNKHSIAMMKIAISDIGAIKVSVAGIEAKLEILTDDRRRASKDN